MNMLRRTAAMVICLLPLPLLSACGGDSPRPAAASVPVVRDAAPARTSSDPVIVRAPDAGVREVNLPSPAPVPAGSPIRFSCDHDLAHADSLLDPTVLEVPPDATLTVTVEGYRRNQRIGVALVKSGGGEVGVERTEHSRGIRVRPAGGFRRGEAYTITVVVSEAADFDAEYSVERSLTLRVPLRGVIDATEADVCGDGRPDRIITATEGVEVVCRGVNYPLPLPDMTVIRSAAVADFDLDGRMDVAVLGMDAKARPVVHWLRNTSLDGVISFQAVRVKLPAEVTLPVSLHAVDLGRDGLADLVVPDFLGNVHTLMNRLRGVENPDLTRPFEAGQKFDASGTVGRIRSSGVCSVNLAAGNDILLSGTTGSLVLSGASHTLVQTHAYIHAGAASWAAGVPGDPALLLQFGTRVGMVRYRARHWEPVQELLDTTKAPVEAMAVCGVSPDRAADILLAYRDGTECVIRRFAETPSGMVDMNGRRLGDISRVNAVRRTARGSLLVCAETGLWELGEDDRSGPVLTFDSRVVFGAAVQVAVLPPMQGYVLADIDGDGRLDVAGIADEDGKTVLGVWLNRIGGGGPGLVRTFSQPLAPGAHGTLAPIDVNRDGMSDVLLLPKTRGGAGLLFIATGGGLLREESPGYLTSTPDNSAGPPAVVDLNGDGFADLFWPTPTGSISFSNALLPSERGSMLPASGAVLPQASHPETGLPLALEAVHGSADFTGNGRQDIVATVASEAGDGTRRHVAVYRNEIRFGRQTPDFRERVLEGDFADVRGVVAGEFAPGRMGAAALVRESADGPWLVAMWTGLDERWVMVIPNAGSDPGSLQAIDADGDGDSDLVLSPSPWSGSLVLHVNDGSGLRFSRDTISSATLAEAQAGGPVRLARLQDLDGDGKPDLLAQAHEGGVIHSSGQ